MPQSVDEWSDFYWDRSFVRQSSQVETAKLVVTFSLAVAGSLIASALQSAPINGLDIAASIVLGAAFTATIVTILLDRLKWPERQKLLDRQQQMSWDDLALLDYIRLVHKDTEAENKDVVRRVIQAAVCQIALAAAAGTLAVVSLFQPAG
jgi:hypothetical protein